MTVKKVFLFILLIIEVILLIPKTSTSWVSSLEQEIISNNSQKSSQDPTWFSRPRQTDPEVTPVSLSVSIRNIEQLGNSHNWKFHLITNLHWNDYRLAYDTRDHPDYYRFRLDSPEKAIWVPDIYFPMDAYQNGITFVQGNDSIAWIHPNGDVFYSSPSYPIVEEEPRGNWRVKFSSYGYTTDELKLKWMRPTSVEMEISRFGGSGSSGVRVYSPKDTRVKDEVVTTSRGNFSRLYVNIQCK